MSGTQDRDSGRQDRAEASPQSSLRGFDIGVAITVLLSALGGALWLGHLSGVIETLKPDQIEIAKTNALASITKLQVEAEVNLGQIALDTVPASAVVAFANTVSTTSADSQCPKGWKAFDEARGRIVIGAGIPVTDPFSKWEQTQADGKTRKSVDISTYAPMTIGGEQSHILTIQQIPSHNHSISTRRGADMHDGLGGSNEPYGIDQNFDASVPDDGGFGVLRKVISSVGGDEAHSIMPPYIALYYCLKVH